MTLTSSEYINQERREYSLYVMTSRAICAAADGLKAGGRRALWTARNGSKYKTATLAGATMPIHPHAECTGAINTLAAPYGNNIPLFKGDGAFGTLLHPTSYGAARYTSVTVSKFTQDVVFADIEIIPMMENYDGSLLEPVHFLPLIPIALLNPSEGIAVGFASNIMPRRLEDIVNAQLAHLKGAKKLNAMIPHFGPTDQTAIDQTIKDSKYSYLFAGKFVRKDTSTLTITHLPYSQSYENVVSKLDALLEVGTVLDYTDKSKNLFNIEVKFKRGALSSYTDDQLLKLLGLIVSDSENLNVLDFTGKNVWSTRPEELIREFTDWRLSWYVKRYQRLLDILKLDLSRLYDIRTAIKNNVAGQLKKIQSRSELKEFLEAIGVVNLDYIADLGIYRFTEEERLKNEERIKEAEKIMADYQDIISSPTRQVEIYSTELKEVLAKYK